jgi:ABC-type dipeptide/oligopeptide/nickel transport system permease component
MTTHTHPSDTPAPVAQNTSGLPLTSLILGIVSVLALGLLTGIPAIITGTIALRRKLADRGLSIAGIILGSIGTFFSLLVIGFFILMMVVGFSEGGGWMNNGGDAPGAPNSDYYMPMESSRT